ncbi:MAG: response regulator transcription factor [Spirosomataceae bacterium]
MEKETIPQKILIIEDDRRIAQLLTRGLTNKGFEIEVAYTGLLGLRRAEAVGFDLVILDINLPEMSGYEVCKRIRSVKPTLPILMLTAMSEIEDKIEGFEAGTDDYIVKPFDFRELYHRVIVGLRRNNPTLEPSGKVLRIADLEVFLESKLVKRAGREINLTAREYEFLIYLVKNKGKVISKNDIAANVWDVHFDTGTNVIEVYINILRRKIDRDFEPKLIHTRPGLGYLLRENP